MTRGFGAMFGLITPAPPLDPREPPIDVSIARAELVAKSLAPIDVYQQVCTPGVKFLVVNPVLFGSEILRFFADVGALFTAGTISRLELAITPSELDQFNVLRRGATIDIEAARTLARAITLGGDHEFLAQAVVSLPEGLEVCGFSHPGLAGELYSDDAVRSIVKRPGHGRSLVIVANPPFRGARAGESGQLVDSIGSRSLTDLIAEATHPGTVCCLLELADEWLDTLRSGGATVLNETVRNIVPRTDFGVVVHNTQIGLAVWDLDPASSGLTESFDACVFRTEAGPKGGGGSGGKIGSGSPSGSGNRRPVLV